MQVAIEQIAKEIRIADGNTGLRTRTGDKYPSIVEGLTATKFKVEPDKTYRLKPAQTLTAQVDRFELTPDGKGDGYQRKYSLHNIWSMSRDMKAGDVFPPGLGALNNDGTIDLVDGQQRAIASVIAGTEYRVEVLRLTQAQRIRIYDKQADGQKIKEDDRVLRQTGPVADYLRLATADVTHTFHPLLENLNSSQARWVVAAWTLKRPINSKNSKIGKVFPGQEYDANFVPRHGDETAALLKTWGKYNEQAIGGYQSKAIISMAIKALGATTKPKFQERWNNRMHLFEWDKHLAEYRSFRSNDSRLLEIPLIDHWNSGLPRDSSQRIS